MVGEVIKEFLVGLGFEVDESSLNKFNKSIASAALRVTALYASIKATTAAVAYGISKISQSFEQLGYEYKILAPAINKALILRREMFRAYSAAGVNLVKVVRSSAAFNLSLEKTRIAFEALYRGVASRFFDRLARQSDLFRVRLYENMPRIQDTLEKLVNYLFRAFDATLIIGERVWGMLTRLHEATSGVSTVVLGMVVAWRALNLAFLTTPIGLVLTGLLALIALYDDFQVWKEGGKSYFDWSDAVPIINTVTAAMSGLWKAAQGTATALSEIVLAYMQLRKGDYSGAASSAFGGFGYLAQLGLTGPANLVTQGLANHFGGADDAAQKAAGSFPAIPLRSTPLGGTTQNNNSTSNQNVNQQTTINIQGVADAQAASRHSSSEQSRVNMDLIRNLKGATR